MNRGGSGAGFQWWGPHNHARRSAQFLLAGVATICAAYVAIVVGAIAIGIAIDRIDVEPGHESWQHRLGLWRVAAALIALIAFLAAAIAYAAVGSIARRAVRLARARSAARREAVHAQRCVDDFALAVGMPAPRLLVVDDPAVNGFAAGRHRSCTVCVTTGALARPADEVQALCAQTITSVANRSLPLACAAADLVAVARWCTKLIWLAPGFVLVSTLVGVPIQFAAAATLAIMLVVVATLPLLALTTRALPRLRDESARLSDLDAVELTNEPASLARLLLAAAEDRHKVVTSWQIAHLWFDPDTAVRVARGPELAFDGFLDSPGDADPDERRRTSARASRALVDRARVLVDMTSGEPQLRAQLEAAERG